MTTAELIEKVRLVDIKIRGLTRDMFSGGYHSAFKGRGMSFSEVRAYSFGDDVRAIDWNVTARTGDPFIKVYEEERELTVMLVVDVSGSSYFGANGRLKSDVLAEIAAVLAFSATSNQDKVGLLLFADGPELFLPPKKGRQHALRILRELLNAEPAQKATDLGKAMQYLNNVLKKRTIAFLLSDFQTEGYARDLRIFAQRHDLTGICVYDDFEKKMPEMGILPVIDPENGQKVWIDTSTPLFLQVVEQHFHRRLRMVSEEFTKNGAGFISINTADDYVKSLMRYFENRKK